MMLQEIEKRVNQAFDRVKLKYSGWLPFQGRYLTAVQTVITANLGTLRHQFDEFFTGGDVHKLIDFLIDFAKGNLALKFPLNLFANQFLEGLRDWLHKNSSVLKEPIGSL